MLGLRKTELGNRTWQPLLNHCRPGYPRAAGRNWRPYDRAASEDAGVLTSTGHALDAFPPRTGLSSQIQSSRHSGNSVVCPRSVPSTKRPIRSPAKSRRNHIAGITASQFSHSQGQTRLLTTIELIGGAAATSSRAIPFRCRHPSCMLRTGDRSNPRVANPTCQLPSSAMAPVVRAAKRDHGEKLSWRVIERPVPWLWRRC
jgi:hypothetical protein